MSMSSSSDGEATYSKISIEEGSDVDKEAPQAGRKLLAAMALRERYAALNPRQLLWTYDGANAFSVDNLPEGTEVSRWTQFLVLTSNLHFLALFAIFFNSPNGSFAMFCSTSCKMRQISIGYR